MTRQTITRQTWTRPAWTRRAAACAHGCALALFTLTAMTAGLHADDTEIFFGQTGTDGKALPNVLFVLDTSGSMNFYRNGGENPSSPDDTRRIHRLEDAMHRILDTATDINVGLVRFNGSFGGGTVMEPMTNIDDVICRDEFCHEIRTVAKVERSAGDAEENLDTGAVSLDGFTLTMGRLSNGLGTGQMVGLSFEDVEIPQGARIVSARIDFTADASDAVPSAFTIAVEPTDDARPFTTSRHDISERQRSGRVSWAPGPWTRNSVYESADIASLVQQVTDRRDWCGTNTLNLSIGGIGSRDAMSTRRGADKAPRLEVIYDASAIPVGEGCISRRELAIPVAAGGDDVSQFFPNYGGRGYTNLDPFRMPRWSGDDNDLTLMTGLRFTGVDVPEGAVIEEAWLTMSSASDSDNRPVSLRIEAQDASDAAVFDTGPYALSDLPRTGSPVRWSIPPLRWNQEVRSPDLTDLIRDIVSRDGWKRDNAIALILRPQSGNGIRDFNRVENGGPARLHITFRDGYVGGRGADRTAREVFKQAVSDIEPEGATPIPGALYEASQYLRGGPVDFGRTRGYEGSVSYDFDRELFSYAPQPTGSWRTVGPYDFRSRDNRTSHPDSWSGGELSSDCPRHDPADPACVSEEIAGDPVYVSPMASSCQTNQIVLLSDGQPSSNGAAARIEALTGADCFGEGPIAEQCGAELADWLQDTDHDPENPGFQNITTYTVGFDLETDANATRFLKGISSAGGGRHFDGSSTDELVDIFQDILGDVRTVDTAFVSAASTVNQYDRLTHRDDIYFALFQPAETVGWAGNLKRYKVVDEDDAIVIKDVEGKDAIDERTGFFASDARSFWSDTADGADVRLGGFVESLALTTDGGSTPRRVYTYTGPLPFDGPVDLSAGAHELAEDNDAITHDMLGIEGEDGDYRRDLLRWARGVDVLDVDEDGSTSDIRHEMGDPMHSQPVILNYGDTARETESTIFVSTNQGFLHAIDPHVASGPDVPDEAIEAEELFSWIPAELLDNLDKYYVDARSRKHHYGLDGPLSLWIDDRDNDLTVDAGEDAFLFASMRRGGSNYYALDVSERTSPKLAWVIRGGPGGTPGFENLGQSWSQAVPARIHVDGEPREVVIFTGGYDTAQDPDEDERAEVETLVGGLLSGRPADARGNALYIVDLRTGELIWSGLGERGGTARFDGMDYGMPGTPEVLDVDVDGFVDQIYASDTGGQVWRFDITPYHRSERQDGGLVDGGVMARLGSGLPSEERRFYHEPDVSLIERDGKRFASISIGSGWRAHPLDTVVEDRFYVLRTPAVYDKPEGYGRYDATTGSWNPVTDADLADADDLSRAVDIDGPGWFKRLDTAGEKVLAPSLTVNDQVTFTTYMPTVAAEPCAPSVGTGALYLLDVVSGRPVADLDGDGNVSRGGLDAGGDERRGYNPGRAGYVDADDDRRMLRNPGLPPPVAAIITGNNQEGLVGTERQDLDYGLLTRRTHWTDLSDAPERSDMADLPGD